MNVITISLFICGLVCASTLTDDEIEKVKNLVDAELLKREMDVIMASPKPAKPTTKKTKTTKDPDHELQNSIDNCFDVYGEKKCKELKNLGMDCEKERMNDMCEKTCGFCGNHMNPMVQCKDSQFGCCDDGLSVKKDPFGETCPVCKDNIPDLCEIHDEDCNAVGIVGGWMRTNCKKTCGVCTVKGKKQKNKTNGCEDDKDQADFCPVWKEEGLCENLKEMMKEHCPKTCSLC